MNRQEHLLTILSEECMEVAQRVSKALRFGIKEIQPGQDLTNAARIKIELNDLFAIIDMLEDEGILKDVCSDSLILSKKLKVENFLKYSEKCGTLTV